MLLTDTLFLGLKKYNYITCAKSVWYCRCHWRGDYEIVVGKPPLMFPFD